MQSPDLWRRKTVQMEEKAAKCSEKVTPEKAYKTIRLESDLLSKMI